MASAWSPSVTFKLWDFNLTISAHVGSIGGKFNVNSGKSFDISAAYGMGLGVSADW